MIVHPLVDLFNVRGNSMNRKGLMPKMLLLLLAVFVFAAAPAIAQVKIRGTVGYGFGTYTHVPAKDVLDATEADDDDIEGLIFAVESNIFFTGKTGDVDYRLRFRLRGIDRPEADGDSNTFKDQELQTVRGHIRWKVSDMFSIRIANAGTGPVAMVTENDPIQNIPCILCRNGEISDEPQIDFRLKFGALIVGAYLTAEAPTNLNTTGVLFDKDGDTQHQKTGGSNAQTIGAYFKLKDPGFIISGFFITSSADNDRDDVADPPKGVDGKFDDFAGSASGLALQLVLPLGIAKLKFDFQDFTSDLAPVAKVATNVDSLGIAVSEQEVGYIGVKVEIMGLYAAINIGTETFGGDEDVATVFAVHYRIPVGKGSWVGPELAMSTVERTRANPNVSFADEEVQTLRFLMKTKF